MYKPFIIIKETNCINESYNSSKVAFSAKRSHLLFNIICNWNYFLHVNKYIHSQKHGSMCILYKLYGLTDYLKRINLQSERQTI